MPFERIPITFTADNALYAELVTVDVADIIEGEISGIDRLYTLGANTYDWKGRRLAPYVIMMRDVELAALHASILNVADGMPSECRTRYLARVDQNKNSLRDADVQGDR